MKKRIVSLLLCLLLLWLPAAMAEEAAPATETGALAITTADGLTVTHIVNDPNLASFTDAELLMQHYAATGEYDKAFTLNQQMAVQGDLDALYRVGCHYLTGVGVDRDEAAAMECLQDASLLGHADAARVLAEMPSEAAIQLPGWDDPAIQAQAALALGEFWREGRGGTMDAAHAIRWYEHAASLAIDPEASWAHEALADLYLSGEAGAIDPEKAIAHLLQHTLYQGAYGQYRVGRLYWDGLTAEDGTVLLAPSRRTPGWLPTIMPWACPAAPAWTATRPCTPCTPPALCTTGQSSTRFTRACACGRAPITGWPSSWRTPCSTA